MFRFLEERDRWNNTVIIVTGDHAKFDDQKKTVSTPVNDAMWTSAIIAGVERLIGKHRLVPVPASHVDLHPTILKLVGDGRPTASLGRDLLQEHVRARPYALAVRNGGTRFDTPAATLMLERRSANQARVRKSFPFDASKKTRLADFPMPPARVEEAVRIWTYPLEANRGWHPGFLEGSGWRAEMTSASR